MRRVPRRIPGLALAALLASCGPAGSPPVDGSRDAREAGPTGPRVLTFVIDQLSIDPTDSPDVPHSGFNLDDLYSIDVDPLGCTHPDYYSLYDNDQHCAAVTNERCTVPAGCNPMDPGCVGGVDNQLATLANTLQTAASVDIRATVSDAVRQNRLALLVRVRDVNDLMNDPSVDVSIYRGYPTFGSDCSNVLPGREYAIDSASVTGGTDIDSNPTLRFPGSIVAGRLRIRATNSARSFELPLSLRGLALQFPTRAIQLRANIANDGLSNGSFGGWVKGDDLITPCLHCGLDYLNVVRGVIGGLADIQLDGVCDGSSLTPQTFGGISLGFGIHAVPAIIVPRIVSGPPDGACGSTPDAGLGDAAIDTGGDAATDTFQDDGVGFQTG